MHLPLKEMEAFPHVLLGRISQYVFDGALEDILVLRVARAELLRIERGAADLLAIHRVRDKRLALVRRKGVEQDGNAPPLDGCWQHAQGSIDFLSHRLIVA